MFAETLKRAIGGQAMPQRRHTCSEKFLARPVVISRYQIDYSKWRFRRDGSVFYADGPCPQCFAPDQHDSTTIWVDLPDSDGGAEDRPGPLDSPNHPIPDDEHPDVAFECRCGCEHGVKGATGCGAKWLVTWQTAT